MTYAEDSYERLSKMAPTVLFPYGALDYEERLLEIGNILNKEQEAKQRLEQFQEKVTYQEEQLSEILDQDTKIVIIEVTDSEKHLVFYFQDVIALDYQLDLLVQFSER
ncbi:ABC transporter substrate-binding protein [Gracilibacillus sp. HCP3S3_G5_1]|uniref:ABC transporter substrate-binding protein n=1 Tax=Gracilibacillus sp. HCP3S3_G5_1 TaxID=3438940 RepID=UPI003F8AECDB